MSQQNIMEAIWQSSSKGDDGQLHYPEAFIDFLWGNGFIDSQKFSNKVWKAAFEPFKQKDGTYRLTHDEFLSLEKFRYTGEIHIPFDAMRINEGKYTDEGFQKLVEDSVAPSCSLPPDPLKKIVEGWKAEFRQADDLILIQLSAKLKIKKFLEENPSPLRKLELMFDDLLKTKETQKKIEKMQRQISPIATPEQLAELQQSAYSAGATHFLEVQSQKLKAVAKTKSPKGHSASATGEEGEKLKNIKRSKKGIRG